MDYFIEKCQEVYFCTDEYSDSTFIATTFGLYNIFIELAFTEEDPSARDEYQHYIQMCKDNLEAALANMSILMPATLESAVALTIGVSLTPAGM